MHQWLDSWVGLGLIVDGMARQGFGAPFYGSTFLSLSASASILNGFVR
jgi:hypothetical protein